MPKLYVAKLLVLACAICAQAFIISPLPGPIGSICPNARQLGSSSITAEGNEIVHLTFNCTDGTASDDVLASVIPKRSVSHFSRLESRSQAECTTPAAECQCGVAVDCTCLIEETSPSQSDCQTLVSSTGVIASSQGPTFLVQPKTFHVISLNTCSLGFFNFANFTEEFCWDDLGNQGNSLTESGCFGGNLGLTSGVCLGRNQRFLTYLGHSS